MSPVLRLTWRGFLACALALAGSAPVKAQPFPRDAGLIDVRAHGAVGDGVTDDTRALRRALAAAQVVQGRGFWPARMVYLPAGTYRVTDTLQVRGVDGRFRASMDIIGDGPERSRIVLADAAPGFTRADQPKPVILATSGLLGGDPSAGGKDYLGRGEGNDAYGNYIEGVSIDVGRGNPGAIGIDFLANNVGALRRVHVRAAPDSGHTGLSMERRWPGPLLLADVRIDGFATGLALAHAEYGVTVDGLVLESQREVALRNQDNVLSAHRVVISGSAVPVVNSGHQGLILIDDLLVKRPDGKATQDVFRGDGHVTWRRLKLAGLDTASPSSGVPDGATRSGRPIAGFAPSWALALVPAPVALAEPPSQWVSVTRYGARPDSGEDAAPAIRAAMASGAAVVYFPSGNYFVGNFIDVPVSVRRIEGFRSSLRPLSVRAPEFDRQRGMLRVEGRGEPLIIARLALDNMEQGHQTGVEHAGGRTLVLRDLISAGVELVRRAAGGPLHLENVCCGKLSFQGPQGVWARQLNTEGTGVRVLNDGAPLLILGLKTEQNCTAVESLNGARSDILGGLLYMVHPPTAAMPAFVVRSGATMSAAYAESSYRDGAVYADHFVAWDADGTRRVVKAADLPRRARGRIVPGLTWTATGPPPVRP